MRHRLFVPFIAASMLACLAAPAAAQQQQSQARDWKRTDLTFGVTIVHDTHTNGVNPSGWLAAAHLPLGDRLGLVGEMGGNYGKLNVAGTSFDFRTHAFMGGVRFSANGKSFSPFGQVLVGGACYCGSTLLAPQTKSTAFAIQPGGGLDVPIFSRLSIRVQGDVRTVFGKEKTFYQVRFATGVSVALTRNR